MSELSMNQLVSRRNFLQRATDAAKLAGLGVALRSFESRVKAASSAPNPWAYDDTMFRHTDPKLIGYTEARRFRTARSSPFSSGIYSVTTVFQIGSIFLFANTRSCMILEARILSRR